MLFSYAMVSSGEVLIGTGIDLLELERFRAAYGRHGERFLERLFTDHEIAYCKRRADPVPELSVRFAAKEAAFKAIGTGWRRGVRWRDVEVRNAPSGRPYLVVGGRVAEIARRLGGRRFNVTLTHSATTAAAQVMLLGEPGQAPWADLERIGGEAPGGPRPEAEPRGRDASPGDGPGSRS